MISPETRRWNRDTGAVASLAALVSVASFLLYYRSGAVLLCGDSVAHINIARRVFDSRTPGILQLGTVWLPLPHLLMIPFLLPRWMWQTGIGGSIPSMVAYVLGAVGIFRLAGDVLGDDLEGIERAYPWLAALIFIANPNLIYLQSTAMTEALYLALFIWAVTYFFEFVQQVSRSGEDFRAAGSSLTKCGLCLLAASLTRYDGWFLSAAVGTATLAVLVDLKKQHRPLPRSWQSFFLLAIAGPLLWLGYNSAIYRNPLEFANGPYSARAIEKRNATPGSAVHPGTNDLPVAATYFLKSAQFNVAIGWQRVWLVLLILGTAVALLQRRGWPPLLLWVPLPFYVLSIAYGGVPIFMPVWWPFSFYNVRYGLQMLPAFALFLPLVVSFAGSLVRNMAGRSAILAAVCALVAVSYLSIWRSKPIVLQEAWVNSRSRVALEAELARDLRLLPPKSSLLMYLGGHVGALQQAGIPLRRVICEGNHRTWKQPSDPHGLWELALVNPELYADFVIAVDSDPVALMVNRKALVEVARIHVSGQPEAIIYRTVPPAQ